MSEKLEACPFCSGEASAPYGRNYRRAISCKNCDACVYADTDAKAIAAITIAMEMVNNANFAYP